MAAAVLTGAACLADIAGCAASPPESARLASAPPAPMRALVQTPSQPLPQMPPRQPPVAQAQPALAAAPINWSAAPADNSVILDMHDAFVRGDQAQLTALLPLAHGHPLEPWAAYWALKARLESAQPAEVQAFLQRWAGTYQEDRLRNDWLLVAGKRRDWASFAAEYLNFRMRDDPQVACYAVAMDALQGATVSADDAAQARRNWFAQRDLDDGCLLAANVLHQRGQMTDTDLWRRARVALEAGRQALARAAAALAAPQADTDVAQIQDSAVRYLFGSSLDRWQPAVRAQLVALALVKAAAQDPDQAAELMNRWGSALPGEARNWVWGAIGKEAALHLSGDALNDYAHVGRLADLNDDMLAWLARAALRQERWQAVQAAIDAMRGPARQSPAWVYWSARARIALARSTADQLSAGKDLARIAGVSGYYPKLALEELGGDTAVPPAPAPLTAQETDAARRNPGLARALLMIAIGLRPEGVREWNYWTNLYQKGGMSDRQRYAAAALACQAQVWDRCINTSDRTRGFMDYSQRFPMPYRSAVQAAARQAGIDPAYVYGLIRQESRFITVARSSVGASGLMQLMPATARWTARRIGLDYSPGQLQERSTNLLLGTSYLKLILDDFDGSQPLAAAAYNAGPRHPRAWRMGPTLEGAIWVENIPLAETRNYVQQVLANTTDYAAILTGQPQTLKSRLGRIGPPPMGTGDSGAGLP
ncbi:MAG: lytic transglycosylase domain-containing protein [Burkholderiaceae bacterium]|nr:lytic transglycosylase domain-containing protein [Burkholderiaceae bacterium]